MFPKSIRKFASRRYLLELRLLKKIIAKNNFLKSAAHLLLLVSAAAPGAVSAAGVGVIAGGGGGHLGGGRVASVRRVPVAVAGAGHSVHHVKHRQPEKQLEDH